MLSDDRQARALAQMQGKKTESHHLFLADLSIRLAKANSYIPECGFLEVLHHATSVEEDWTRGLGGA